MDRHFNTSHVTVYLARVRIGYGGFEFQYIPCYGLSFFMFKKRYSGI